MSLYFIIIILLLLAFADDCTADDDRELWESAKKQLAERTREYIKQNPMSEELQSFIGELRKPKRRKRQDHSNMYAIKDGDILPLVKLEEQFNTESNLGSNFTVVPLIIPIQLENTMASKQTTDVTEDYRRNDETGRPILGRGAALMAIKEKKGLGKSNESQDSGTEETVVDNLIEEKLRAKSTSEATELNKVLEDVQNLISAQKKGKGTKEGVLCNVSGYWDSNSGGMTFHIKKFAAGPQITMRPTEPPSEDGFIMHDKWNVSARIPFKQFAQVIITLTAYKGRRVAIFLGECRVCDGSETITGDWVVGRTSSDCKDQKSSHAFVSDVFRKNNVETLREDHIKKLSSMTTAGSTSTESEMS